MRVRMPDRSYKDLEPTAEAIWRALASGVRFALSSFSPPPDPYSSEIAYRREPYRDGKRRDWYQAWPDVIKQKHGDCEDLSMFLVVYLVAYGLDPDARVALIEWPSGGWHAVVLRRNSFAQDHTYRVEDLQNIYGQNAHIYGGPDIGWDPAGWWVEDPSRRLGMRDSARGSAFSPLATSGQREKVVSFGNDPYLPFELEGKALETLVEFSSLWANK